MDAKAAVDRVGRGKHRDVSAGFLAMISHYVLEPEFCNPAAGWEKGQVEKNVRDARHRLRQVAQKHCRCLRHLMALLN